MSETLEPCPHGSLRGCVECTTAKIRRHSQSTVSWIPDNRSKFCMLCSKKFTFRKRRHHCRRCGLLLCQSCSKYKDRVPGYKKPVRVCNVCLKHKDDALFNVDPTHLDELSLEDRERLTKLLAEQKPEPVAESEDVDTSSDEEHGLRWLVRSPSADKGASSSSPSPHLVTSPTPSTTHTSTTPLSPGPSPSNESKNVEETTVCVPLISCKAVKTLLDASGPGLSVDSKELQIIESSSEGNVSSLSPAAHVLLLDCRSEEEFSKSHLPGAVNLPLTRKDIERKVSVDALLFRLSEENRRRVQHSLEQLALPALEHSRTVAAVLLYMRGGLMQGGTCAVVMYIAQQLTGFAYRALLVKQAECKRQGRRYSTVIKQNRSVSYLKARSLLPPIGGRPSAVYVMRDGLDHFVKKHGSEILTS